MTIPEEIDELKIKLAQTADEREQAIIILEILNKYGAINSAESQTYIDQLLYLAEKLSEPRFRGWGLYSLTIIKFNKGEYDIALSLCRQAISIFEMIKEVSGIVACYNNMGVIYYGQGNYSEGLKNHFASLKLKEEIGDKSGVASSYNNIGVIYESQGNYPEALKNHFASLKLREEARDKSGIATSYNNIGLVYYWQGNYSDALNNYWVSLKLREEIGDKPAIANSCNNIGVVYEKWGNYPEALKNYFASVKLSQEIGDKHGLANSYNNIGNVYGKLGNYSDALKNHFFSLKLKKEIGEKYGIAQSYNSLGAVYQKEGNFLEARKNYFASLKLGEKIGNKGVIKESSRSLSNAYKTSGDFENALKYHEIYHKVERETLGEQAQKQLTNLNFIHNLEQKEKDLEIEHLRNVELKAEKERSESLLLNILPASIAEELKEKGRAEAKLFENVTVIFTDFADYTIVAERLTPQQLVDELHACFSAFDIIMEKLDIEKIKTVRDTYLAVSGLPQAIGNHAEKMVNAAHEIRTYMLNRHKELGDKTFEVRIGIHSGRVVAGIVGIKKFAYDIWGDTVNSAARMEQNSEAGKINISQTTYELVKDKFTCTYRGEIEAKNKGLLRMYFVG